MNDLNVVIAGSAGEGIQTIGAVLAETVSAHGYAVFTWQEYESRIRGGQNSFSIRIGEAPQNVPLQEAHILLPLNEGALTKYQPLLKEEGILVADKETEEVHQKTIAVPFLDVAEEELGNKLYANTVAVGALVAVLGMELDTIKSVLDRRFSTKGEDVIKANHLAAEKGYHLAEARCKGVCPWQLPERKDEYYLVGGNQMIALGAAYAGCRFISAYPMTPSTGIITFMVKEEERLGVFAEQAEDEIAAINMAIGAGFAGARAMTATSGGGFALMVEGISLAGMTETPVVIVLGQRPGPATGLPTRTGQGELLFAIYAGHGEFPKMVLAPSDPKDALHKTVKAFNMADKYQIPVIVLTDQFLADSGFSIPDFGLQDIKPEFFLADPSEIKEYGRYRFADGGISPRLYPGQSNHLVGADSDEHDQQGHITEDLADTAEPMLAKRLAKLRGLQEEISPPEAQFLDEAGVVLIGWGSSRNAIMEAIQVLQEDGIKAGMIHFTELWPLPAYAFPEGKEFRTVENNATGQLGLLLRSEYGLHIAHHIGRRDGLPLTANYIRSHFNDH
jgi:2-oxoglutarate ferredoxin oxidoreductase subunit alpha